MANLELPFVRVRSLCASWRWRFQNYVSVCVLLTLTEGDSAVSPRSLDLVLRIVVLVIRLPRESDDYLMILVVGIDFIVGDVFVLPNGW